MDIADISRFVDRGSYISSATKVFRLKKENRAFRPVLFMRSYT